MSEAERAAQIGKTVIEWQEKTDRLEQIRCDASCIAKDVELILQVLKEERSGDYFGEGSRFTLVDEVNSHKVTYADWPDVSKLIKLITDIECLKNDLKSLEELMARRKFAISKVA